MGRDILFIERNLQFLKPGGRMAIVLPQGRFNNISDARVRKFITERCRILAVVGLNVNTFKPHTGTKTSVLFVQKWNDDPQAGPLCPKVADYPIFFATSQHPGKDNSGNYIYLQDAEGELLLDLFGHPLVDHDLFDTKVILDAQLKKVLARDAGDAEKCAAHQAAYEKLCAHLPDHATIAEGFHAFALEQGFGFAEGA